MLCKLANDSCTEESPTRCRVRSAKLLDELALALYQLVKFMNVIPQFIELAAGRLCLLPDLGLPILMTQGRRRGSFDPRLTTADPVFQLGDVPHPIDVVDASLLGSNSELLEFVVEFR